MNNSAKSYLTGLDCSEYLDCQLNIMYYHKDPVLGEYAITIEAKNALDSQPLAKYKVGAVLATRRNRGLCQAIFIISEPAENDRGSLPKIWARATIGELLAEYPTDISSIFTESLINLASKLKHPSEAISFSANDFFNIYAYNPESATYMLAELIELKYIKDIGGSTATSGYSRNLRITALGWESLNRARQSIHGVGNSAFVAMSFAKEMEPIFDLGIRPALETLNYKVTRIDKKEHNNKICDEIIAEIRRSKLLVADFTGHRGGVYFEAGLAYGLGKHVIWIADEKSKDDIHFDTRQYNHIFYKNHEDLHARLIARIQATIV